MTIPVLIDCDPGHDDAVAILLALGSPELELLGVTTVAGNAPLDLTTANAIRVLELAGSDVPVAAGAERPLVRTFTGAATAHGASGMDGPELPPPRRSPVGAHAVDFLAEQIAGSPAPPVLVPTGPLTNVALLLAHHPGAAARLRSIVLMGGAVNQGNVTPSAEFNIWADPEAARRVFQSGLDVTMVGLEVTHKALLRAEHADGLRAAGAVGRFVAELLDFCLASPRLSARLEGTPVHDAVAVAAVVSPGIVRTLHRHVDVECAPGLCTGRTVVDVDGRLESPATAHVGVDVDAEAFARLVVERIGALGRRGASAAAR